MWHVQIVSEALILTWSGLWVFVWVAYLIASWFWSHIILFYYLKRIGFFVKRPSSETFGKLNSPHVVAIFVFIVDDMVAMVFLYRDEPTIPLLINIVSEAYVEMSSYKSAFVSQNLQTHVNRNGWIHKTIILYSPKSQQWRRRALQTLEAFLYILNDSVFILYLQF